MALSSGHLVTSAISPRAGKGAPDCSKTTPSPSDYTLGNTLFPKSQSRMRTEMVENAGKYSRGFSRTVAGGRRVKSVVSSENYDDKFLSTIWHCPVIQAKETIPKP